MSCKGILWKHKFLLLLFWEEPFVTKIMSLTIWVGSGGSRKKTPTRNFVNYIKFSHNNNPEKKCGSHLGGKGWIVDCGLWPRLVAVKRWKLHNSKAKVSDIPITKLPLEELKSLVHCLTNVFLCWRVLSKTLASMFFSLKNIALSKNWCFMFQELHSEMGQKTVYSAKNATLV